MRGILGTTVFALAIAGLLLLACLMASVPEGEV